MHRDLSETTYTHIRVHVGAYKGADERTARGSKRMKADEERYGSGKCMQLDRPACRTDGCWPVMGGGVQDVAVVSVVQATTTTGRTKRETRIIVQS